MALKITRQDDANSVMLTLEGRLCGAFVQELLKEWQATNGKSLAVDLRDVTHVDSSGMDLLRHMYQHDRAEFIALSPLSQYFAEQARINVDPVGSSQRGRI